MQGLAPCVLYFKEKGEQVSRSFLLRVEKWKKMEKYEIQKLLAKTG